MKRLLSLLVLILSIGICSSSFAKWNEHSIRKGQPELLKSVIKKAGTTKNAVVVFDLDSTLFDNRPRNLKIFQEFAKENQEPSVLQVKIEHFKTWIIAETLANAGLSKADIDRITPKLTDYWKKRFFTSEYVKYDRPLPGAVDYVKHLYTSGAKIAYVTGRNELMRKGTEAALTRHGFPLHTSKARLLMKPASDKAAAKDTDSKAATTETVKSFGTVIAAFDNEPEHVNLYSSAYAGSTVVFVDTDHSPKPDKPSSKLPVINGWLMK